MVGVRLADCEDNVHTLVDVWNEGVLGVFAEVAGEFAEGFEVGLIVEEVGVGEYLLGALWGHDVVTLEAFFDETDPLQGGLIGHDVN